MAWTAAATLFTILLFSGRSLTRRFVLQCLIEVNGERATQPLFVRLGLQHYCDERNADGNVARRIARVWLAHTQNKSF